jgi:hypothetical protein
MPITVEEIKRRKKEEEYRFNTIKKSNTYPHRLFYFFLYDHLRKIEQFLEKNKGKAFTAEEIHKCMGYNVDPKNKLEFQFLVALATGKIDGVGKSIRWEEIGGKYYFFWEKK